MEAILPLCAIILVSLIALRLLTRAPAASAAGDWKSHPASNVPWRADGINQRFSPVPRASGVALAEPAATRIVWVPAPDACSCPLLRTIDTLRTPQALPFALDFDAAYLEAHAQAWAAEHWPETTWLTGHIRQQRIDALCQELERERQARRGYTQSLIDLEPVPRLPVA